MRYSRCGTLSFSGAGSLTYTVTFTVFGEDGTEFFTTTNVPETLAAGITRIGCTAAGGDPDTTRLGASYSVRLEYTADNGATGVVSASAAYTNRDLPMTGIVISQFRPRGPRGDRDQFLELTNISNAPIDVGDLVLQLSASGSSIEAGTLLLFPNNVIVNPGCSFLVTSIWSPASLGYSGSVPGDASGPPRLRDEMGFAIRSRGGEVVDQVALMNDTVFKAGTALDGFGSTNSDRSYLRVANSGDNRRDFVMITPSTPRNCAMCGR